MSMMFGSQAVFVYPGSGGALATATANIQGCAGLQPTQQLGMELAVSTSCCTRHLWMTAPLPCPPHCRFTPSSFQQPWTLQLVGAVAASKLPGGDVLLQFEFVWPSGVGNTILQYCGTGAYNTGSGSGLLGLQRHATMPESSTLDRNGTLVGISFVKMN